MKIQWKKNWKRPAVVLAVLVLVGASVYLNGKYAGNVSETDNILGQATLVNENGQGVKMHTYAFAAQAAIVSVNVKTGEVAVDDTVLAVDVGHAINPDTVEGQMHGGMAQAIGWSLMEEEFMKDGKMRNHTFHDYLIPTAMDLPKLRTIIVEHPNSLGPYGAKGIGEPPIVGAAPAIHNAIRNAVGVSINELPMTPVRVLDALRKARAEQ